MSAWHATEADAHEELAELADSASDARGHVMHRAKHIWSCMTCGAGAWVQRNAYTACGGYSLDGDVNLLEGTCPESITVEQLAELPRVAS